ncbi:conserved hypothetical protein [Ricinus communis]|uniref:Transmembrane protein n=1 Tax=Ricinus communis TaxID=3988 RepID=B9RI40_RICCO|nr:conserved hypothetical protein [Ricinus communis]
MVTHSEVTSATAYLPTGPVYPPPPIGYPTKDGADHQQHTPAETKSKGDGFWKGGLALFSLPLATILIFTLLILCPPFAFAVLLLCAGCMLLLRDPAVD